MYSSPQSQSGRNLEWRLARVQCACCVIPSTLVLTLQQLQTGVQDRWNDDITRSEPSNVSTLNFFHPDSEAKKSLCRNSLLTHMQHKVQQLHARSTCGAETVIDPSVVFSLVNSSGFLPVRLRFDQSFNQSINQPINRKEYGSASQAPRHKNAKGTHEG